MRKRDLLGQKFHKLLVIQETPKRTKQGQLVWLCQCDCGEQIEVASSNLVRGGNKSCGCWRREVSRKRLMTHGACNQGQKERLYRIWRNMKNRCFNKSIDAYHRYGGRGIQVCDEWRWSYMKFKVWALRHGYQGNLTIDRIDNDGHYEPQNCQWITRSENSKKYYTTLKSTR